MGRDLALTLTLVAGVAACNALFGVDDYAVAEGAGGQGGGGLGGSGAQAVCLANEVMTCYEGPADTEDVGSCAAGTKTCLEDGSGFGACQDQVTPVLDDCATADDEDCNGRGCGEPLWSRTVSDDDPNVAIQRVLAVASDDDVVVITGQYTAALRIGGTLLPGDTTEDGFVAALDESGNLSWIVRIAGATQQRPASVGLDAEGNVYVAGSYRTELTVGGTSYAGADTWGVFVMQLDPGGGVSWVNTYHGAGDVAFGAMDVSDAGEVAVAGAVTGDASFGGTAVSAGTTADWFVALLETTGDERWVQNHDASVEMRGLSVVTTGDSTYAGGLYTGDAVLDGQALAAGATPNGLLIGYDAGGAVTGHLDLPSGGAAAVEALAIFDGDVIAGGNFTGDIDVGDGMLRPAEDTDLFVARYSASLDGFSWAHVFGAAGDQRLEDLAVDALGEITLVGSFAGTLDLGGGAITESGGLDIFVGKLDEGGQPRFSASYGDAAKDTGVAVSLRPATRELYVGGYFAGTIAFGMAMHAAQGDDGFLVRLAP